MLREHRPPPGSAFACYHVCLYTIVWLSWLQGHPATEQEAVHGGDRELQQGHQLPAKPLQ